MRRDTSNPIRFISRLPSNRAVRAARRDRFPFPVLEPPPPIPGEPRRQIVVNWPEAKSDQATPVSVNKGHVAMLRPFTYRDGGMGSG